MNKKKTISTLCLIAVLFPSVNLSAEALIQRVENKEQRTESNLPSPLSALTSASLQANLFSNIFKQRTENREQRTDTKKQNPPSTLSSLPSDKLPSSTNLPLVSILVEENLLTDKKLRSKIERYALDAQNAINGQAILVTIPTDADPFEIYEGNAALYLSGLQNDQRSQLVGTVLIGNIPLPQVEKNGQILTTVFPYTDFENLNYVWDETKHIFVYDASGDEEPEIWHGIINSNRSLRLSKGTGELEKGTTSSRTPDSVSDQTISDLIAYFDRNHQVHTGQTTFKKHIFYADLPTQKAGIPPTLQKSYQTWIDHIEDIYYHRFTTELVDNFLTEMDYDSLIPDNYFPSGETDLVPTEYQSELTTATTDVDPSGAPDIFAKNMTEAFIKRYFELNESWLARTNETIRRSGRWQPDDVDTTISLVSKKDEAAAELLKKFNDKVEEILWNAVDTQNVARDITIPTGGTLRKKTTILSPSTSYEYFTDHQKTCPVTHTCEFIHFPYYWNGQKIADWNQLDADEAVQNCSLLRGNTTGKIVEFNRVFNLENIDIPADDDDIEAYCLDDNVTKCCALIDEDHPEQVLREQCRFEDVVSFDLSYGDKNPDYRFYQDEDGNTDINNNMFDLERLPLFDYAGTTADFGGNSSIQNYIGAKGCDPILLDGQSVSGLNQIPSGNKKSFSSLMNHIEPTPATIMGQYANLQTSPAMDLPIDSPRGFSFYDNGSSPIFHRLNYPNIFELREKFTTQADNIRAQKLLNEIDTILDNSITEINNTGGNTGKINTTLFQSLWTEFDKYELVEALMWLDQTLEQKNTSVFTSALKNPYQAQTDLLDPDFNGYELIYINGEAADYDEQTYKIAFEQGLQSPSDFLTNQKLRELNDQNRDRSVSLNNFYGTNAASLFSPADTSSTATTDPTDDDTSTTTGCDRSLLKWTKTCLVPWVKSIPQWFGKKNKIVPPSNKSPDVETLHATSLQNTNTFPPDKGEQGVLPQVISATTTPPEVKNLVVSPSQIHIPAGQLQPIKISVSLCTENGTIPLNEGELKGEQDPCHDPQLPTLNYQLSTTDYQTTVTLTSNSSELNQFFSLISPAMQTAKAGQVHFFLSPQAVRFGGQFSIDIQTNTGVSKNIPVTITTNKIQALADQNQVTVGQSQPVTITANIMNSQNQPSADLNGQELIFSTADGELKVVSEKIVANEAQALFFPGIRASEAVIKVQDVNQTLPPQYVYIELLPDKPHETKIITKPSVIVAGAEPQPVQIQLADQYGNLIDHETLAGNDLIEIETMSGIEKNKEGIFWVEEDQRTENREQRIENTSENILTQRIENREQRPEINEKNLLSTNYSLLSDTDKQNIKYLSFTPNSPLIDLKSPTVNIPVITDAKLTAEINDDTFRAGDQTELTVTVRTANQNGNQISGTYPITIKQTLPLTADSQLKIPTTITTINGETNFSFPAPTKKGTYQLHFSAAGFADANINFTVEPNTAHRTEVSLTNSHLPKATDSRKPIAHNLIKKTTLDTDDTTPLKAIVRVLDKYDNELDQVTQNYYLIANPTDEADSNIGTDLQTLGVVSSSTDTKATYAAHNITDINPSANPHDLAIFSPSLQTLAIWNRNFAAVPLSFTTGGRTTVDITSAGKGGKLYLLAVAADENIIPSSAEIDITETLSRSDFDFLSPKSFLTVLLGNNAGDLNQANLANEFIFDGQTQAVVAATPSLGFGNISVEDGLTETNVGWHTNWKPATLLAAGNSIGQSVKYGASDALVLYGDPTLSLPKNNPQTALGLTEDTGTILWKSPQGTIHQVITGDLNLDGRAEIFALTGQELQVLYHDSEKLDNYRHNGPILRFGEGVKTVAAYPDTDKSLASIIQLTPDGDLIFHENNQGVLTRTTKNLGLEHKILDLKVGHVNQDSYADLVVLDVNNTLWFVHGRAGREFYAARKLYDFAPKFANYSETHNPNSSTSKLFATESEYFLQEFFVSENGNFVPLNQNRKLKAELELSGSSADQKITPGETITSSLKLTKQATTDDLQIYIPHLTGFKNIASSFRCQNCTSDINVQTGANGNSITDLNFPTWGTITLKWQAKAQEIPAISFLLQDFAGNDGIDDIAVPWTSDDGTKKFIKFTSTGTTQQYPLLQRTENRGQKVDESVKEDAKNIFSQLSANIFNGHSELDSESSLSRKNGRYWIKSGMTFFDRFFTPDRKETFAEKLPTNQKQKNLLSPLYSLLSLKRHSKTLKAQSFEPPTSHLSPLTSFAPPTNSFPPTHHREIDDAFPDAARSPLMNGTADYEQIAEDALTALATDNDGDGLPDNYALTPVEIALKSMACGGRCGLPIPSYAFMAPGQQSLYIPPFGFPSLPTLPIPGVGLPALQIIPSIPFVLPFVPSLPVSLFRLFVAPTITGQVGLGICVGPPTGFSIPPLPVGNCFVVVPPLLELIGACPVNILGQNNSPALLALQSGFQGNNTGTILPKPQTAITNVRTVSADIITAWLQAQFNEFANFRLPKITFEFPRLPQKTEPATAAEKSTAKDLINSLEESDFFRVNREVITIPYPSFSADELTKLKRKWTIWKDDFVAWKCESGLGTWNESTASCDRSKPKINARINQNDVRKVMGIQMQTQTIAVGEEIIAELEKELATANGMTPDQVTALKAQITSFKSEIAGLKTVSSQNISQIEVEDPRLKSSFESYKLAEKQKLTENREQRTEDPTSTLHSLPSDNLNIPPTTNLTPPSFSLPDTFNTNMVQKMNLDEAFGGVEANVNTFEQNLDALESYAQFAEDIQKVPQQMKQVFYPEGDLTNNSSLPKAANSQSLTANSSSKAERTIQKAESQIEQYINTYFQTWMAENKSAMQEWGQFKSQLFSVLKIWESIPQIFAGLSNTCAGCEINRGSMMEWALRIILGAIKLPVIGMPQLQDMTIDFSSLKLGLSVTIPDIKLEPTEFQVPDLPVLPRISEAMYADGIEGIFTKVITGLMNFDFNLAFKGVGKQIATNIVTQIKASGGSLQLSAISYQPSAASPQTLPSNLLNRTSDLSSPPNPNFNSPNLGTPARNNPSLGTIGEIKLVDLVSPIVQGQLEATLQTVSVNTDIANIPGLPDLGRNITGAVPTIPRLPSLPQLATFGLEVDPPVLDLPMLPTLLRPPVLPNFLEPVQAILQIPKPIFKILCFISAGIIPIPEWKVASRVQEATNRSVLLPIDTLPAALVSLSSDFPEINQPNFTGPSAQNFRTRISSGGVQVQIINDFTSSFTELNDKVRALQSMSKCTTEQIGAISRGETSQSSCSLGELKIGQNDDGFYVLRETPLTIAQKKSTTPFPKGRTEEGFSAKNNPSSILPLVKEGGSSVHSKTTNYQLPTNSIALTYSDFFDESTTDIDEPFIATETEKIKTVLAQKMNFQRTENKLENILTQRIENRDQIIENTSKNILTQISESRDQRSEINEKNLLSTNDSLFSKQNLLSTLYSLLSDTPSLLSDTNQFEPRPLLAALNTIDLRKIPTRTPASFDVNAYQDEMFEQSLSSAEPQIYYYDPATDTAESITVRDVSTSTFDYTIADLEGDNQNEIVYALGAELYFKRRQPNTKALNNDRKAATKLIRWDYQAFIEKFIPVTDHRYSISADGSEISFSPLHIFDSYLPKAANNQKLIANSQVNYLEWTITERPDHSFETNDLLADRDAKVVDRLGFLFRPSPDKYAIRPVSATIKKIVGSPALYGSRLKGVQNFSDQNDCTDGQILKPFYPNETLLIGLEDDTVFHVLTKNREAQVPTSEWKRIHKGEETFVDFAEVCVIRGQLAEVEVHEREFFPAKVNDYLLDQMELVLGDNDQVQIQLFDGRTIIVNQNEIYQMNIIEDLDINSTLRTAIDSRPLIADRLNIQKFKPLDQGNHYGILQAFTPDKSSARVTKLLHDPQISDDQTPPKIIFTNGNTIRTLPFQTITIDASQTRDVSDLVETTWTTDHVELQQYLSQQTENREQRTDLNKKNLLSDNDSLLSEIKPALKLSIPSHYLTQDFTVTFTATDAAGNTASANVQIVLEPINITIDEISDANGELKATISPDLQGKVPVSLTRVRNKIRDTQAILYPNETSLSLKITEDEGSVAIVDTSSGKLLAEVLSTGRPVLYDNTLSLKIETSTEKSPLRTVIKDQTQTAIFQVEFITSNQQAHSSQDNKTKNSSDYSLLMNHYSLTQDTNPSDFIIWQPMTESHEQRYQNLTALIDTEKNKTLGLLDPNGQFYDLTTDQIQLNLKPALTDTDPIEFEIQYNGQAVGSFGGNYEQKVWVE